MKRSSLSGSARPIRTLAMTLLVLVAMAIGAGLDRLAIITGVVDANTQLTSSEEFTILEETYDAIRNNYVLEEEISDEELIYGAARGMINALGDENHSRFLDPVEAANFERSSQGELIGIGIQIDSAATPPLVIAPIPDSPAFAAGILPGDEILAIDDRPTDEMTPTEVGDALRGEAGTEVRLLVLHEGDEEPFEVTITREKIEVNPVSWAMLPDGVLWIQLSSFSAGSAEAVKNAIREGERLGMTGLVFDLRNNGGGLVWEAVGVASQFLPDGSPLFQEVNKAGETSVTRSQGSNGAYLEGPMVVLVNEYSASASEIVSSAIMENGRAQVLGEKTFGTGTVLTTFNISDGSRAVLGIKLWLTGAGEEIYKKGVEPDEVIEMVDTYPALPSLMRTSPEDPSVTEAALTESEDIQLQQALKSLQPAQ
jgi:carboxyl-terminal processing protease